jgi:AGZA family xanthine/uracil permease-like MFS transporter
MTDFLERRFGLRASGSTLRTEILGGVTIFATMAYIIVVNPAILQHAGLPVGPCTVATILTAVFGCLLMGFYANRPIAVAPYMGENAFIAFTLPALAVNDWRQALGAVFVSGVLFLLLTLIGARTWLAAAIPPSLKHAFGIGIGLFMLLIGMYQTGIVTSAVTGLPPAALQAHDGKLDAPPTPLKIGDFREPRVQLALAGFVLMAILSYWKVPAAILLGIVVSAVAGYFLGLAPAPRGIVAWPGHDLGAVALQLDIPGVFKVSFFPILLTLFLMSFLDTLGTVYALGAAGNMLDRQGNFPGVEKPMLVDSLSCMFAAVVGTSTSGAFIESATGILQGARTGLAAVVTGLLFALALFFVPLLQPLQELAFAYGPALMIVGVLMFAGVRHLDVDDWTELLPAVVTIAMMGFTYNIANGLTAGLVVHPLLKLAAGRWRQIHPGAAVLGAMCLLYYVAGMVH